MSDVERRPALCHSVRGSLMWEDNFSNAFFFFFLIFSWRMIAFQCVFVAVVQQCESAIAIHKCLPSHSPHPPLKVITEHKSEPPVLHNSFPLATYFTHGSSIYMSMLASQLVKCLSEHASCCSFPLIIIYLRKVIEMGHKDTCIRVFIHFKIDGIST